MPLFRYKAVDQVGEVVDGEMEASSQSEVIDRLHDLGHVPIRADAVAGASLGGLLRKDVFGARRIARRDVASLTRELATLLNAGLPLDQSLEILIDLADRESAKKLLLRLFETVRGGGTLGDAIEAEGEVFPRIYASLVRAGEAGGSLDEVLLRLSEYMEEAEAVRESVKSALIYPVILMLTAASSIVFLLIFVIPQFQPIFEEAGQALPLATQIVMAVGSALKSYWWVIALLVLLGPLLARGWLKLPGARYRWDGFLLRLPLLGEVVAKIEVARFARTLATLLSNGVALLNALAIVRQAVGNAVMAEALEAVAQELKQGRGFARPLAASGVFPKRATHLLRVGEETGRLDDMLLKVAEIYDQEVRRSIQRMLAVLTPLLTIGLGLIVAGILGSILVATFGVYELV